MSRIKVLTGILLAFSILLFTVPCTYSGVPQIINYQGKLTDNGGNPVSNGNYDIEFKIYDVASGGTALWTETWNSGTSQVTVSSGVFNVMLGAHNPLPTSFFADHSVTYLGIKVGTDTEMLPRQQITSVGYAFTAGDSIPKGGIIMWSGQTVPNGWALCNGQNGTPDLRDKFILGGGGNLPITGGTENINLQHSHTVNSHNHKGYSNGGDLRAAIGGEAGKDDKLLQFAVTAGNPNGGATPSPSFAGDFNYPPGIETGWANWTPVYGYTSSESPETNNQLNSSQSILPPYFALAFIMKL